MVTQEINSEDRHLDVDGIRSHVRISGAGPTLVLIHGLGGPLMWQKVMEPLSAHFQVITIDLPGFGDSASPGRHFSTSDHADFVSHCLNRLNCESINLCGISYGGQIAAMLASRHRTIVKKLILIASTGLMEQPLMFRNELLWATLKAIIKNTFLRSEALMCKMGTRSFYYIHNRPIDLCARFFAQLHSNGRRDAWLDSFFNVFSEKETIAGILPLINAPTLIVWGENDDTVSPEFAEEFHRAIIGSSLVRYKECGHSVPLEKPEELVGDIIKFCNCAAG
jgi:pimeloyl-ACP methyl ester carboxylesterase